MQARKQRSDRKTKISDRKNRDIFAQIDEQQPKLQQARNSDEEESKQAFQQITILEDDGSMFAGMTVVNEAYVEQYGKLLTKKAHQIHQASNYVRNDMYYGEGSQYDYLDTPVQLANPNPENIIKTRTNQLQPRKNTSRSYEFYKPPPVEEQQKEEEQEENVRGVVIQQSSEQTVASVNTTSKRAGRTATKKKTNKRQRNVLEGLSDQEEPAQPEETPATKQEDPEPEPQPEIVVKQQKDPENPTQHNQKQKQKPSSDNPPPPPQQSPDSPRNSNQQTDRPTQPADQTPVARSQALINDLTTYEQLKHFLYQPIVKGSIFHCTLKRINDGFRARFQLFFNDDRPMMAAQNSSGALGCNYHISLNREMDKRSKFYMGKLRSDVYGSMYSLYDSGENPKSTKNKSNWRETHANIKYESNFLGVRGPRKLQVWSQIHSEKEQENARFKLPDGVNLPDAPANCPTLHFKNKQPKWNDKLKSYALNFGGRVKIASIKNFILTDVKKEEENYLIFGKAEDGVFSLSFVYPFSPYQAFGIALSSFDFKLTCE